MKNLITAAALAATAFAVSAPASFAMTALDSQLERAVYNDIKAFGLDDTITEAQIGALTTNELVLISNILADEDKLNVADVVSPVVEHRINDIVAR